jgi:hypothetical protein
LQIGISKENISDLKIDLSKKNGGSISFRKVNKRSGCSNNHEKENILLVG